MGCVYSLPVAAITYVYTQAQDSIDAYTGRRKRSFNPRAHYCYKSRSLRKLDDTGVYIIIIIIYNVQFTSMYIVYIRCGWNLKNKYMYNCVGFERGFEYEISGAVR